MSVTRVSLQPAFVLHHRPYRDTSALLEVFTPEFGRVGLVARGLRSAKSRLQGIVQPFRPLLISWSGRGELGTLTGCEADGGMTKLDGPLILSGFYLNELLLRLLHRHDPHPALFECYGQTLQEMQQPDGSVGAAGMGVQRALRLFEKHLLREIGYALMLDHEAESGAPIEPGQAYNYHLERGPLRDHAGTSVGIRVQGSSLLALLHETLHDTLSLRESKHLMRAALGLYLGSKPLQSRELYIDFQKDISPARAAPVLETAS
ncbi:MAG: DNA repair protein RecO [Gammaproteobacteria bacterium]|nr:DNA repair protein RecO [Gammaproteobacteria bacterium]